VIELRHRLEQFAVLPRFRAGPLIDELAADASVEHVGARTRSAGVFGRLPGNTLRSARLPGLSEPSSWCSKIAQALFQVQERRPCRHVLAWAGKKAVPMRSRPVTAQ